MPALTLYALLALALVSMGFGAAYKVYQPQVDGLNLQIKLSNEDARRKQLEAIESTERAEQEAQIINVQLESEHDKNIKLNNDLAGSLATIRMRVPTKLTDCRNTLSKSTGAGVIEDSTDTTELPDDFAKLLRAEALRADNLAVYAGEAYQFIATNCGIK